MLVLCTKHLNRSRKIELLLFQDWKIRKNDPKCIKNINVFEQCFNFLNSIRTIFYIVE